MARPGGIEPAWILPPVILDPLRQRFLPFASRFMTRRHQHERRMIPVSLDDPIRFFVEHALHRCAGTDLIPHTRLDLEVEAEFICGLESSFGRGPGMEPHVVQAPVLAGLKNLFPRGYICRRITSDGEIATVVSAAKDHRLAIE